MIIEKKKSMKFGEEKIPNIIQCSKGKRGSPKLRSHRPKSYFTKENNNTKMKNQHQTCYQFLNPKYQKQKYVFNLKK